MANMVDVVSPQGEFGQIPSDQTQLAFDQGYKPLTTGEAAQFAAVKETHARFGKLGSEALGVAHQFVKGATAGLSDVLADAVGIDPKMINALDQQAGTAGKVANFAGTAVGMAGATALAGPLGATGVLTSNAAGGALFGIAETISEWEKNPHLTGEQAIAHVGLSTLLGGAAGVAGLGVESLLKSAAPRMAERAAAKAALAEERAVAITRKEINMTASQVQNLVLKDKNHVFEKVVARDFLGKDAFETLEKTQAIVASSGEQLGGMYEKLSHPMTIGGVDGAILSPKIPAEAQGEITKLLGKIAANPAASGDVTQATKFASQILNPEVRPTAQTVWTTKKQLGDVLYGGALKGETQAFYQKAFDTLSTALENTVKAADTVQPGVLKTWKTANEQFHVGTTIQSGVAKAVAKAQEKAIGSATAAFGLKDAATATAMGVAFGPGAAASYAGWKIANGAIGKAFGGSAKQAASDAWSSAARAQAAAIARTSEQRLGEIAKTLVSAARTGGTYTNKYTPEDLQAVAANLGALQQPLSQEFSGLSQANAHVGNAAMLATVLGVQRASEMLPKSPPPTMLPSKRPLSDFERMKQQDVMQAAMDPYDAMANPNPTKVAVMQQVYPEMYKSLVQKVFTEIATGKVHYTKRAQLAAAFGFPLDYFTQSGPLARLQNTYQLKAMAEGPGKQPTQTQATNAARQMQTMTENIGRI